MELFEALVCTQHDNHNSKQLPPPENVGLLIVAQRDPDQRSAVVERLLHAQQPAVADEHPVDI